MKATTRTRGSRRALIQANAGRVSGAAMRPTVFALAVLVPAQACGGSTLSVDPVDHFAQACAQSSEFRIPAGLAQVEAEPRFPPMGMVLQIDATGLSLHGERLPEPVDLTALVGEQVEMAKDLAAGMGGDFAYVPRIVLVVTADVPAPLVRDAVQSVHEGGITTVEFVVATKERFEKIPYPDPSYAKDMQSRMDVHQTTPEAQIAYRDEMMKLVGNCTALMEGFQEIASSSNDEKCGKQGAVVREAMKSCRSLDGDKVITALQLPITPLDEWKPGYFSVTVSADAEAIVVSPDGTWKDLASQLEARKDGAVWLP